MSMPILVPFAGLVSLPGRVDGLWKLADTAPSPSPPLWPPRCPEIVSFAQRSPVVLIAPTRSSRQHTTGSTAQPRRDTTTMSLSSRRRPSTGWRRDLSTLSRIMADVIVHIMELSALRE